MDRYNRAVELSSEEIAAFLDETHTLVLATHRGDGSIHQTTVWYRWDGHAFWLSTNRDRAKYRHIARNPRVSVLVDAPERETAVSASGVAKVAATDEASYDGARAIIARYVSDPDAYLGDRAGEQRVLLRIRPDKLVSWKP